VEVEVLLETSVWTSLNNTIFPAVTGLVVYYKDV